MSYEDDSGAPPGSGQVTGAGLYAAAAEALDRGSLPLQAGPGGAAAVLGLLAKLGWDEPAAAPRQADRVALLRLAGRCRRVFRLASPLAPGAAMIGAELAPADFGLAAHSQRFSLAGRGETLAEAFAGCFGEAAEALAFLEWGDERRWPAAPAAAQRLRPEEMAWLQGQLGLAAAAELADEPWLPAELLPDGPAAALPLRLCLRQAAPQDLPAPSGGVAAGAEPARALAAALWELVERDAVALWWYGGHPARAVSPEQRAAWGLAQLEGRLRAGAAAPRRTWFLDLTGEPDLPVLAALSDDGAGGPPAMGFAAAPEPAAAGRAALLELCQMELSQLLIGLKLQQQGADALTPADRQSLGRQQRAAMLAARPPAASSPLAATAAPGHGPIAGPVASLAARGLRALAVDLGRPGLGMAVMRAVVPGLETLPLRRPGPRLAAALADQGREFASLRELATPI